MFLAAHRDYKSTTLLYCKTTSVCMVSSQAANKPHCTANVVQGKWTRRSPRRPHLWVQLP